MPTSVVSLCRLLSLPLALTLGVGCSAGAGSSAVALGVQRAGSSTLTADVLPARPPAASSAASLHVSPNSLSFSSTTPQLLTVWVHGHGDVSASTSDATCATVSPSTSVHLSATAAVQFTVSPVTAGNCTISVIAGRARTSVPVSISLPLAPGAGHWLILPRSEPLSVTEPGFAGTFRSTVSRGGCVSASPVAAEANNGTASFKITAAAVGSCYVTLAGARQHTFKYDVYHDDWSMYGYDQQRTSNQTGDKVALTMNSLSKLKLRWKTWLGMGLSSTPLVSDGRIYVEGYQGQVAAVDAKTGSTIWKESPFGSGTSIHMTPVLDHGTLFVGQHDPEGSVPFSSIDAETGNVNWTINLPGNVRSDPLVIHGTVYIGTSGGDPPACVQGGLYAINEATGSIAWHYVVDTTPGDGGSVWSPVARDGSKLIVGTGNTCSYSAPIDNAANSLVALSAKTGRVIWISPIHTPQTQDNDMGAGGAIYNGTVYALSKNGNFYIVDEASGAIKATISVGLSGWTAAATPSTDGSVVIVAAGYNEPLSPSGGTFGSVGGPLYGFDMSGQQKWMLSTTNYPVLQSPTMVNGMVFAGMDSQLNALDEESGAQLWTFPFTDIKNDWMYASPVVTQSGVYAATQNGMLYAFDTRNEPSEEAVSRRPFMIHPVKHYSPEVGPIGILR